MSPLTSFYLDCAESYHCGALGGQTFQLPGFLCPCKRAIDHFFDRVVVPSNSLVFSDGERTCDPLNYYYEMAEDKWWKCCGLVVGLGVDTASGT